MTVVATTFAGYLIGAFAGGFIAYRIAARAYRQTPVKVSKARLFGARQ